MNRLKNALANAALVLASLVFTVLAVEGVLRVLPIAWALPVEPPTAENPIQRYKPDTPATWSMDWNLQFVVHGRSNAQGWLADYDYDPQATTPLVAVVGDSFMEALRVPFRETVAGRLAAKLGPRGRAYVFAQSGSPLSQYVAYAQHACATYHPQKLVVNVVGNDFDESVFAHRKREGIYHLYPRADGGFDWRLTPLPPPSFLERLARHSAIALYVARNLNVSGGLGWFKPTAANAAPALPPFVGNTASDNSPARVAEGERVIDWFLAALPGAACLPADDIVITVDAIRPELYDGDAALEAVRPSYFGLMRTRLMEKARAQGFRVVDTEPLFKASFARDGRRFDFPHDLHWNSHGHEVVAAAVAEALRDWRPLAGASEAALPER